MNVYRIQPQGAELHGIETESSDGTPAGGVHVFRTLPEVVACGGWYPEDNVELVTIECEPADLRSNGDYEGDLLRKGRGRIVHRQPFASTSEVSKWAEAACRA